MLRNHRKDEGAVRLRKPEGAAKSESGKLGQFLREFFAELLVSDGHAAGNFDESRWIAACHVDFR